MDNDKKTAISRRAVLAAMGAAGTMLAIGGMNAMGVSAARPFGSQGGPPPEVLKALSGNETDHVFDVKRDFGAIADGTLHPLSEQFATLAQAQAVYPHVTSLSQSIDWAALQGAIHAASQSSEVGVVYTPKGVYIQNETITMKSNVAWIGDGRKVTVIRKTAGFHGEALRTEYFNELTGTAALHDPRIPKQWSISGMTFDGNYLQNDWKSAGNSYVNTSGGGFKLYARYFKLDCEVFNMAGIGIYSECSGEEIDFGDRRDIDWALEVLVCKEECIVFKGPPDGRIAHLFTAIGGARVRSEWNSPPPPSPTYGSVNGGLTDNIVFDGSAGEIEKIHTWGCLGGKGIRVIDNARINCDFLMAESCRYGGIEIAGNAYGMIDRIDVHGCGGGMDGSAPDCLLSSGKQLTINSVNILTKASVDSGQDRIVISGVWVLIGQINIRANGCAGHGITLSGNYCSVGEFIVDNAKGTAADGRPSAAMKREAVYSTRLFRAKGMAVSCDRAFLSIGTPAQESIEIDYRLNAGQLPFEGTPRNTNGQQRWTLGGSVNNVIGGTSWTDSAAFNSAVASEQTLLIPHRLLYAPSLDRIWLTVQNGSGTFQASFDYLYVSAADATSITVKLKLGTAMADDQNPRITISASL